MAFSGNGPVEEWVERRREREEEEEEEGGGVEWRDDLDDTDREMVIRD